jgi:hypothetical protein
MTIVRIEKLRVFLLKSSWVFSTVVELHFNCIFSCSWAFSTAVELYLNCSWTALQPGSREVQPGSKESSIRVFPRTSLVNTGWTGPRGGSTGVRVTWPVWPPDWQTDCQSDHQAVEPALGVVQPVLGPIFAVWPAVCQSDWQTNYQPAPDSWTGPRGSSTGSPQPKSAQRLVLKPHLYILTPTSLPTQESMTQTPFLTWRTPPTLSHTSLASPISNLWREIFEWVWELRFLCFISKSLFLFFIRALVLHRVLCGFITLGASSS